MAPVNPKVTASSVVAAATALLTTYVFVGSDPGAVEAVVTALVALVATFAGGWFTPDESRETPATLDE
ncbi:hypothetical protein [Streptomyces sp. SM12]|uniref:hypothetical protein n=1 Tax=Streptomyces sp. SM12 TaxID=1071602 RepID=UPI000CD51546|nr:hypothetical protein [Streptomyces sp. SM12]